MIKTDNLNITDRYCIGLSDIEFSSIVAHGFFKAALMTPAGRFLGINIVFAPGEKPVMSAFSNAGMDREDYEYIFGEDSVILSDPASDLPLSLETNRLKICENSESSYDFMDYFSTTNLKEELARAGAVLTALIPTKEERVHVYLSSREKLPVRVLIMLSAFFSGADVIDCTDIDDEDSSLSAAIACESLSQFLFGCNMTVNDWKAISGEAEVIE